MTSAPPAGDAPFDQIMVRAASQDGLEELTLPLLVALAEFAGLDCTYLSVFDWERGEQVVTLVHRAGGVEIEKGSRLPIADGLPQEISLGGNRSAAKVPKAHPDGLAAKRLGLRTYVSVPVVVATHGLFGMICGASRRPQPVSEPVVSVMESFARIIADHIVRTRIADAELRAERAEAELRARGLSLAVAEHALKTPLTSLLGAVRILDAGWPDLGDGERRQFLEMAVRNALDLSRRIEGLLVDAKVGAQRPDLAPVEIDIGEFVEPIVRAFDAAGDHRIRTEVEEGLTARADPVALHEVLGNLLDNAIKYSQCPGVISVVAHRTPDGIVLAIVDEGMGLPSGVDVFEAFQRGDDHAGVAPGIGLGLYVVRTLVEAMGGSVTAAANAERGATFTVRLPAGTGVDPPSGRR